MEYLRQKVDLGRHLEVPLRLSFLFRSVHDLFPSPANLCRWGLSTYSTCKLCDRPSTLEHVLSSCSTALTQGRFKWRHDNVLREVTDWLEIERKKDRRSNPQQRYVNFVKPGEAAKSQSTKKTSILDGTTGWNMEMDLGKKLVFPGIVQTNLRHHNVV